MNNLPTAKSVIIDWLRTVDTSAAPYEAVGTLLESSESAIQIWEKASKAFKVKREDLEYIEEIQDLKYLKTMALTFHLIVTDKYNPPRPGRVSAADVG